MNADQFMKLNVMGAEAVSSALARLTRSPFAVKILRAEPVEGADDRLLLGREEPVAGVSLAVTGGISGAALLCIPRRAAWTLAGRLAGKSAGAADERSAMDQSVLKELGNIVCAAYLAALANALQAKILPGVPRYALGPFGALVERVVADLPNEAQNVLRIEVEIGLPGRSATGELLLFLEPRSLAEALGPRPI